MKKGKKVSFIVAAVLIVLGVVISGLGFWGMGFNFRALNTEDIVSTSYEIKEPFREISVEADTADVFFLPSEDGVCRVECVDFADRVYTAAAQGGVLRVAVSDERAWHTNVSLGSVGETCVRVYLPQTDYDVLQIRGDTGDVEIPQGFRFGDIDILADTGDVVCFASAENLLKIATDTGIISVNGISAGAMELSVSTGTVTVSNAKVAGDVEIGVSTGKTYLSDLRCKNLVSDGSTGDISLKSVIAEERFVITRTTGDVAFSYSDAAEIFVQTDTGDVTGTVCSDKVFLTETNTGDVDVPGSITGGRCEIVTNTGDIALRVE